MTPLIEFQRFRHVWRFADIDVVIGSTAAGKWQTSKRGPIWGYFVKEVYIYAKGIESAWRALQAHLEASEHFQHAFLGFGGREFGHFWGQCLFMFGRRNHGKEILFYAIRFMASDWKNGDLFLY